MKDLLTIKEFSQFSGIEQTTLRYWDDIGLFSPIKRDPLNNYRYYSVEQIMAVKFINILSDLNVPLKTINKLENIRTPELMMELIMRQEKLLDMEMRRLHECYSIIHERLELIHHGLKFQKEYPEPSTVLVLKREEMPFILGPSNEFREGETFHEPFMRFCNQSKDLRINLSYPIGAFHENMDHFLAAPGQPDNFFSLDPTGNNTISTGQYLVGYGRGNYGELHDLAIQFNNYKKEHHLVLSGPVYTLYLHDEICLKNNSDYLVQVFAAVDYV